MVAHAALYCRDRRRPSRAALVEAGSHARRTSALGLDCARAARRAPRAVSLHDADGELIELIRTRRSGRPGFVAVGDSGHRLGRFYPTISGAAGLTRYWVGGGATQNYAVTGPTNWSTASGGANNASVPDAGDNVIFDAGSAAAACNIAGASCFARSVTCTGYTGTFLGAGTLTIGDASGGALTLVAGMTISGTWALVLASTSTNGGAGWSITSAGKTFPSTVTCNGAGGKWILQDAFACTGVFALTSGAFFGNGKSMTLGSQMNSSNSGVRTLDITNCTVTVTGVTANTWQLTTVTNLTFTSTGSTIILSGAAADFLSGNVTYNTVRLTGSGVMTTGGTSATFANFERTGTAVKSDSLAFAHTGTFTVTGTLTFGGNTTQGINRLSAASASLGTQRTFSGGGTGTVAITGDVDFGDTALTNFASVTNTGSAFVGDVGGNNTTVTTNRTSPLTLYRVGAAGNWTTSSWALSTGGATGQRVPLPQDTVMIDGNASGSISIDMPRIGGTIDCSGFAGSWNLNQITRSYGSVTLGASMTANVGGADWILAGRGSHTITSNGAAMPGNSSASVQIGTPTGTYTLTDALRVTGQLACNVLGGSFASANFSVQAGTFSFTIGTATLGTSTLTATSVSGTPWSSNNANITLSAANATLVLSGTGASARILSFRGGQTIGTVTSTTASSGQLTMTATGAGTVTIGTLNVNGNGSARTVAFTAGSTWGFTNFNVFGVAGQVVSLVSQTPGTPYTFSLAGRADAAYLSVTDLTVTQDRAMFVYNGTNVSGNTRVYFVDSVISSSDTPTGTDTSGTIAFSSSDTGTGTDSGVVILPVTPISSSDSATGTDAGTVAASTSSSDSGSGADAGAATVELASSDTGAGSEAATIAASILSSDTGTSSEAGTIAAALQDLDAFAGIDDLEGLLAVVGSSEDGTGSDAGQVTALLSALEQATGADVGAVLAQLSDADSGSGIDAELVTALLSDLETVTGADSGYVVLFVQDGDTFTGIDSAGAIVVLRPVDLAATIAIGSKHRIAIGVVAPGRVVVAAEPASRVTIGAKPGGTIRE